MNNDRVGRGEPPVERFATLPAAASVQLLLLAILTLGFAARVITYRSPLFDFHAWRQADTAAIARNFVHERFNPLYPQVDSRGAQPHGYVESGLELHAFAVAALSKVFGFSTSLGRVLNVLLFPVAAFLLFRFVQDRYGTIPGLTSAFIYSLGLPLTIFIDRAFMNESGLALLALVCLWAAQAYCASQRMRDLAILLAASMLIAVVKPTYLVVCGAVAGLFVERFGKAALIRWELWLIAAAVLLSAALWFSHARSVAETTGLSFGVSNKLMNRDILLSPEYPFKVARRLAKDVLGPVGVVFTTAGAIIAVRRRRIAELLGLIAYVAYLVVVSTGNFHHNYYQLPIVPVAAVLTGLGIVEVVAAAARRYAWSGTRAVGVYAAILWLAAISTLVRSISAHNWYEIDRSRLRLCEDLKPLLTPGDRVVFVNELSPDILFCLDRKGWLLDTPQSTAEHLRRIATEGGSVAVTRRADREVTAGVQAIGQPLLETPEFLAFRLVTRQSTAEAGTPQ